ncbi:unnamed protein product [Knipowitschia caucasica]|uniref:RRM domain-containing protein n=1 Tax=Knipowitschia caucasica TaxID=637954 RepID=A0AAV2LPA9_KNICA
MYSMNAAKPASLDLRFSSVNEDDLFDAALSASVDKNKAEVQTDNNANAQSNLTPATSKVRKKTEEQRLYIGKFPWWITEEDILLMTKNVGVRDITGVKFAENKANGLSKGYAEITVSSEESMKTLLDYIPKCTLGGEKIDCYHADTSTLSLFEDMAQKSVLPCTASTNMNDSGTSFLPQNPFDSTVPPQFLNPFPTSIPSVSNPFLSYPHHPYMFLNLMRFPPNPAPVTAGPSQGRHSCRSNGDEKIDTDFEELINRNKAVASTAITKAVSGATTGDLPVAMETLLTAISIIKQSQVYKDDRCQAMVTSLKDCLVSIQGGQNRHSEERVRSRRHSSTERRRSSWGERSRSSERRNGRSRDRSRDRTQERTRERTQGRTEERSRERSREQDRYRDRNRNRDRY